MKKILAKTGKEHSRTVDIACMVIGVIMIALSLWQRQIYAAVVGFVLLAAGIMAKVVYITEDGIVTEYKFLAHHKLEIWKWDEIYDIFCEYSPKDPTKVGIHFTKANMMAKRLFVPREQKDEVIELALSQNPEIHYEE